MSRLQKQLKSLYRKSGGSEDGVDLGASLDNLQQMNDSIILELERERERVRREGEEREHLITLLKTELANAKRKVSDLERNLTSKEHLEEEIQRLQTQLEGEDRISRRLRIELMELRLSHLHKPPTHDEGVGSVTSLPDLQTGTREHWTTSSYTLGDRPDLSELIEKHREVSRLNHELQRRCEERLRTSPRSNPPPSTESHSSSFWESKLRQHGTVAKREKREIEVTLTAHIKILEGKLSSSEERGRVLQEQLTSALLKEEEIER